jgi:hypothetical protein
VSAVKPSDSQRRIVFAAALAALIVFALGLAFLGGGETRSPAPRGDQPGSPTVPARGIGQRQVGQADRGGPLPVARSFVGAYLRYESGELGRAEREAILETATAAFAADLLRTPARVPPGARAPHGRLGVLGAPRPALLGGQVALVVRAEVHEARGAGRSLRVFLLGGEGRWAVAELRP